MATKRKTDQGLEDFCLHAALALEDYGNQVDRNKAFTEYFSKCYGDKMTVRESVDLWPVHAPLTGPDYESVEP